MPVFRKISPLLRAPMGRVARNLVAVFSAVIFTHGMSLDPLGSARAEGVAAGYDPAVGSRWTIVSENREEKNQDGTTVATTTISRTEELTIVEKTVSGYRISVVLRSYETQGGTNESTAADALLGALRDVVIRAAIDQGGKPLKIENLEEVIAAQKQGIERVVAAFSDKPAAAAKIRELLDMIVQTPLRDPDETAQWYLETVGLLSTGQNTGLGVGEERRSVHSSPNPFGGDPIKTNEVLRLVEADPATGKVKLTRTVIYDPDAMKEMTVALAKKLLSNDSAEALEKVVSQMSLSMDDRGEFIVEQGMTRSVAETSLQTIKAMGHSLGERGRHQVTVTPLP